MHPPRQKMIYALMSMLALAFTATAFATRSSAEIPAEYSKVVPNDAVVTGFIPDTEAFWASFAKTLKITKAQFEKDPPPNLFFMKLGDLAQTKQKLPAKTSVMFWATKLPLPDGPGAPAPDDPVWGMAFQLPGATAGNTTAKSSSGMSLHFANGLVVATSKGSNYKTTDTGGGRLAAAVPASPFGCAISGSVFKQLATTAKPMMGMGPMMMQGGLSDMTKSLAKKDQQDAQRIICLFCI